MAERHARVSAIDNGQLRLQLLDQQCSNCTIGCGGRCNVFVDPAATIDVPAPVGQAISIGQSVKILIDDSALASAALAGYGYALLGLLIGATIGYLLESSMQWPNLSTLIGAGLGTFVAITFSKRRELKASKALRVSLLQ